MKFLIFICFWYISLSISEDIMERGWVKYFKHNENEMI